MPTTCEIEFENNPQKVVYAGELLRGTVRLHLTKKLNVRCIYIRINGKGCVRWDADYNTTYITKELYSEYKKYFVNHTNEKTKLEPGTHSYPFVLIISPFLPTSIRGFYGNIKYKVRVVLAIPWRFNKEFKEEFIVVTPFNLNDFPFLREPIISSKQNIRKNWNPCAPSSGSEPVNIAATVSAGGFVPLQTVNLFIHVNNQNNLDISHFKVELLKVIVYQQQRQTKTHEKKEKQRLISIKTSEGCRKHEDKIIPVHFDIPHISPSEVLFSRIIKVSHAIRIEAKTLWNQEDITITLPIIIGTKPFEN